MRFFLKFSTALMFALFAAAAWSQVAAPGTPRVAVFSEPGFPYYGVTDQASPADIAADLKAAGLDAVLVNAETLADAKRVNAARFAAIVMPYGNTYPRAAFANLRTFHRAGGSLVTTGIPFTHPVERRGGDWTDIGHDSAPALWGRSGIGVGGFAGPARAVGDDPQMTVAADDPLHLSALFVGLPIIRHSYQYLDTGSVPSGVHIVPAVGPAGKPLVALLVHERDAFKGAVDVWAFHGPEGDREGYLTRQFIARGTVAALARRSILSAPRAAAALRALDALPRPVLYARLTLPIPQRPYSTFQPKMPPPARTLYVADVRKLSHDERLLLISLQGIVNRRQPRIYLLFDDNDRFWLDVLQNQKETDAPTVVADPWSLVDTFRGEVKGAVVCDPKVYASPCVAVCLAGLDDLLVTTTPGLAARVRVPITTDLRGRFKDDADALRYIRTDLLSRLNPYLTCSLDPAIFGETGALDQIIAARGSVFWITGPKVQDRLPGANQAGEMEEVRALFARMPLGAVVRGFWWHGDGVGLLEDDGVALGSRFGKITLVSDRINNLSVHSGVPADKMTQKPRPPAPTLDRKKVYVAFTMSDGDNFCTWRDYFYKYFNDPVRGSFPVGWGMGPTLVDLAPDWARWFYERATPNDEFICDVSGVAYMYPSSWGVALKDRDSAFRYFYDWTQRYMKRMDMKTVRLMNVGAKDIAQVGPLLPGVDFLMPDYGHAGGNNYRELTYALPTGQDVFRAVTSGSGPENLADQIRKRAGAARPAFVNAFIWNWGSKLGDLKKTLDLLGPDFVAVTPSQLDALYRKAK